jgi:hypothetical protein
MPQPRARVGDGFAKNCVDRTRRRAERIFDDERLRIFRQNLFGLQTVRRHEGLRKWNFEVRTQFAREIAFALDAHRLAVGLKMPTPDRN